jgi:[protein-PII] uridylyltransferase
LVCSQPNLDALMLLTLVDGQGVGNDEGWSDWKESLVWQTYRSTKLYLADNVEFFRQRRVEMDELRAQVASSLKGGFWENEIAAHFAAMPERYFMAYTPEAIAKHLRLFRRFLERRAEDPQFALTPAVEWVPHPNRGHTEFWFCGWDRRGLLAKIAGSLSSAGFNILSADAFTRVDSLVLDIFRVCTREFEAVTDPDSIAVAERILLEALEHDEFDFTAKLTRSIGKRGFQLNEALDFPTRIAVDNHTHPSYTLVDVLTPDRLGLLHSMLKAFAEEGLEIALSRVNTEKGAAIDSFYITDEVGQKVRDSERLTQLQRALWKAAEPPKPQ